MLCFIYNQIRAMLAHWMIPLLDCTLLVSEHRYLILRAGLTVASWLPNKVHRR